MAVPGVIVTGNWNMSKKSKHSAKTIVGAGGTWWRRYFLALLQIKLPLVRWFGIRKMTRRCSFCARKTEEWITYSYDWNNYNEYRCNCHYCGIGIMNIIEVK